MEEGSRNFVTTWQYPEGIDNSFKAHVTQLDQDSKVTLSGTMGQDTLVLELQKMELKNFNRSY
jgi:hypothetical protein